MLFVSILFFIQSSNIIFPKTSSPKAANNLVGTFNRERLHKTFLVTPPTDVVILLG